MGLGNGYSAGPVHDVYPPNGVGGNTTVFHKCTQNIPLANLLLPTRKNEQSPIRRGQKIQSLRGFRWVTLKNPLFHKGFYTFQPGDFLGTAHNTQGKTRFTSATGSTDSVEMAFGIFGQF